MAVMNLESLVLRGVNVACDVVMGLERNGSHQARGTTVLSFTRHPSLSYSHAGSDPGMRYGGAEDIGAAHAAIRAGRLGSSAGVLDSRKLAITASRAILSGWTHRERGFCTTVTWRPDLFRVQPPAAVDKSLSGYRQPFQHGLLQTSGRLGVPGLQGTDKRGKPAMGLFRTPAAMPQAASRGK